MSITYELACIDCMDMVFLGKIVSSRPNPEGVRMDVPWEFAGWHGLSRLDHLRAVEKFLILHRGHEMRVLVPELVDPERTRLKSRFEEPADLMNEPVEPDPDAYEDTEKIPERVRKKILESPVRDL